MRIEVYSDVVCPWCYIGKRRFERALAGFAGRDDVEVVYRPYQLDPTAPERPIPLNEHLEKKFGGRVAGMRGSVSNAAREEGIEIDWESALSANTRAAHRLMGLATREYRPEVQRALTERLFAMHFSEGGDVADVDQLTRAAVAAGMDEGRVASYFAEGEGIFELDEELERAHQLGIRAVPTFVFDGQWMVQGAQRVELFAEALETIARNTMAAEGVACGEDGCAA